jgi:outer membrane receptor protein involved in Fe transport
MRKKTSFAAAVLALWILAAGPGAGQDARDLLKMDLEDILGMDVTVFSVRGLTQRQTPGVLTVIDEREIRRSGARDLVDVLRLVPGFEPGLDVQSAVGLGIRGLWAQEGKVLLQLDGIEMNEIRFSCLSLGDHIPVEQIRRIEIIRGPGTSFYGGYAELAVINVVTKGAADLRGFEAVASAGTAAGVLSRRAATVNFGRRFGGLKVKALVTAGRSIRSDRRYGDLWGNSYSMRDQSEIRPFHANLALEAGGLKTQFLADRYVYDMRDGLGDILPRAFDNAFHTIAGRVQYAFRLSPDWTVTPYGLWLRQEPWKTVDPASVPYEWYSYVLADRKKAGLTLNGSPAGSVQMIAGAEAFEDVGSMTAEMTEDLYYSDGRKHTANRQAAGFIQVFYTRGKTLPSIGLRYDLMVHGTERASPRNGHPAYDWRRVDSKLLPWFGVTRLLGKWTVKAMVGRTFRSPAFESFDMNPGIRPETTTTEELEFGYQAGENAFLMIDFFDTRIRGPIIYFYDPATEEESYGNYRAVGSRGVELESRWKTDRGYLNANYSYYRPTDRIASTAVAGHPDLFLGMAAHKASVSASREWGRGFSVNPSLVLYGTRYGYDRTDADGGTLIGRYKPSLLANLSVQADRAFGSPLDLGLAVYNALDAGVPLIQPYDGGHAPLPSLSREIVLTLRTAVSW